MTVPQVQSPVSPRELSRRLAAGAAADLLDVRTRGEHAAAHVPGVRLVPLGELDAAAFLRERGANDNPIYVLCQSGGRARRAIEQFQNAGFGNCVLVEGGTQAWIEAGLPVERGTSRALPLMQQVQVAVGLVSATGATLALLLSPWFALIPLAIGCGLLFAGFTGFCGLAVVLAKMPWNHAPNRDGGGGCEVKP